MREYGKIHSSFWTSQTIRAMSDVGRTLAAYVLTSPHSNMLGCFRLPQAYVAEDLGWDIQTVSKGFDELFRNGFATLHEGSKWLVIHKFLKWNALENPNVGKAAAKLFDQVPNDCPIKPMLVKALKEFGQHFPAEKLNGFETVTHTVPEGSIYPFRNPEPEPEPEPEPIPAKEAQWLTATASQCETPNSASPANRAVEIAVYLRQRGIVGANSANPNIQKWADDVRVTNEILDSVISIAASRELGKAPGVNYLATIMPDVLNPRPARPSGHRSYHDERADVIAQLTGRKRAHDAFDEGVIDVDAGNVSRRLGT